MVTGCFLSARLRVTPRACFSNATHVRLDLVGALIVTRRDAGSEKAPNPGWRVVKTRLAARWPGGRYFSLRRGRDFTFRSTRRNETKNLRAYPLVPFRVSSLQGPIRLLVDLQLWYAPHRSRRTDLRDGAATRPPPSATRPPPSLAASSLRRDRVAPSPAGPRAPPTSGKRSAATPRTTVRVALRIPERGHRRHHDRRAPRGRARRRRRLF